MHLLPILIFFFQITQILPFTGHDHGRYCRLPCRLRCRRRRRRRHHHHCFAV